MRWYHLVILGQYGVGRHCVSGWQYWISSLNQASVPLPKVNLNISKNAWGCNLFRDGTSFQRMWCADLADVQIHSHSLTRDVWSQSDRQSFFAQQSIHHPCNPSHKIPTKQSFIFFTLKQRNLITKNHQLNFS